MLKGKISMNKYDAAVEKIRLLLADWLKAGVELFLELRNVDDSGVWKEPGHASFADFLRAEFPTALGIERYNNVIKAIDVYGANFVRQCGIDCCHSIVVEAIISDQERIRLVRESINRFIKQNGCAPDRNTIRDIVIGIASEIKTPHKSTREVIATESLREEFREYGH
jgi:hypothetical protein